MSLGELRSVLREHGDGEPPANPARHDQVHARIRRIRLRRRLAAAGAMLTTASVLTLSLTGLMELTGPSGQTRDTTVAVQPSSELPERFTADDGAQYTRVATTRVAPPGEEKVTVTVPISGRPLDVAAICEGGRTPNIPLSIWIKGSRMVAEHFYECTGRMELKPLPVPEGATEVTITFDVSQGGDLACTGTRAKHTCEPAVEKPDHRVWNLAIYEWTPPETPARPKAPKAFPKQVEGNRLVEVKTGVWPQDSKVTFEVTGRGRKMGLDQICAGALAARLRFIIQVNGRNLGSRGNCGVWESGPYPMAITQFDAPAGRRITVTLIWGMTSASTNRPVRWSVGLFERAK
ncbi:hypothetical protein [Streptosporangium subroseum]|uniref:hypothetical protein n=1 Tax=Streptosporangium subroseum TaxID=106412 RepID=UPI0030886C59|nr:hypothetical protein OHB15_05615 [Streptosporangium subroseum]